jgi:hypothetical protein
MCRNLYLFHCLQLKQQQHQQQQQQQVSDRCSQVSVFILSTISQRRRAPAHPPVIY